jgi:hypothetical protein
MRHRLALPAAVLAAAALLTACGAGSTGLRSSTGLRVATGHTGSASLTVVTSLSPRADGAMYTEGALAEVRLRGPDGRVVATQRDEPGRGIMFRGLADGRYTVEPALRPCDGNCSLLDPRTDGCRKVVPVSGETGISVRFVVSEPCVIGPPPLQ